MNALLNVLSKQSIIYIIEIICAIVLSIIIYIISRIIYKHIANKRILTGKMYLYEHKPKRLLIIPLIILIVCTIIIGAQYILEIPQVDSNVKINIGASITDNDLKVIYHNTNILSDTKMIPQINASIKGTYEVTLQIPYLNDYISKQITVDILDIESPVIETEYPDQAEVPYSFDLKTKGYTVTDNYDKDLVPNIQIEEMQDNYVKVTYTVSDSSDNTTIKSLTYKIIDTDPPVINLKGKTSLTINLGTVYEEAGATAQDLKDGDLTDKLKCESTVNTSAIGNYTVTYTVSDAAGNKAESIRYITVADPADTNGVIYLTFDDGPSGSITPHVLDVLKEKNVKATFFVLNYTSGTEYLIKREFNEGHTIGLHGYSHNYSDVYSSVQGFMDNIITLRDKVRGTTGYDSTIIRFPGGSSNTVSKSYSPGIMTTLTKKVLQEGYTYFDWNVSSNDAGGAKTSSEVYKNVINGLSLNRSNVVLMHDFGGNTKTLNALADIIDYGLSHGYRFSNITKSTPMVTHNVNN